MGIGQSRWRLASAGRIAIDSNAIRVDSILLRNQDSAFVSIVANVPAAGPALARLQATAVPLTDVGVLAQLSDTLYGRADISVTATGTKQQPVIDATTTLSAIRWSGIDIDRVAAAGRYDDRRVKATAQAVRRGQAAVTMDASWPYDITLFSAKQRNDSVLLALTTDTTELSILTPLFPKGTVDSVKGRLFGGLRVTGTTAAKVYDVGLSIADGEATVRPAGVRFRAINGQLSGGVNALGQDSVDVRFTARTSDRDHVALRGWIANLADPKSDTRFNLALYADSLHAFNRRTVADVTLSTPDTIRLRGTLNAPVLTGSLNVDRGAIFIADPDLARKLAVETLGENQSTKTSSSTKLAALMTNLRILSVPVTLGEDVRLRSTVADVPLTGQLELVKSSTASRVVASTGQLVPGLSLTGSLFTTSGGTYNLNLGIVQREFAVLPGGTVTFDGSSPETPLVDIKARYNVKQFRDRDLGVIVNLKGRMPTPRLELSSDAEYSIAPSDLLSYLVTGAPGFDFGSDRNTQQILASFLSPTVSAVFADRLRRSLGGFVDAFQFELGTYGVGDQTAGVFSGKNITNYLKTATISAEQRVFNTNLYLGVNTGLCGLRDIGRNNFRGIGAKIEYRFRPDLSFQGAYDPPALSRTSCIGDESQQALLGLVPSPSQFSFAVRHTWRF
jgi:autotransporter translocation and assembly factor TamB